jgi:hypothetical protein
MILNVIIYQELAQKAQKEKTKIINIFISMTQFKIIYKRKK